MPIHFDHIQETNSYPKMLHKTKDGEKVVDYGKTLFLSNILIHFVSILTFILFKIYYLMINFNLFPVRKSNLAHTYTHIIKYYLSKYFFI